MKEEEERLQVLNEKIPDSRPAWLRIVSTFPLLALLVYFLFATHARSKKPPYSYDNGNGEEENYLIGLPDMLITCFFIAVVSLNLAVGAMFVFPRRRDLLRKYIREGHIVRGDVFYEEKGRCAPFGQNHGVIKYAHPKRIEKNYVIRRVRLHTKYTREMDTLYLLDGHPLSAQPKEDLEIAYIATERRAPKMKFLGYYGLAVFLFSALVPVYIIMVLSSNQDRDELGGKEWMYFGVGAGATIFLALALNYLYWIEYYRGMIKWDAQVVGEEDERQKSVEMSQVATTEPQGRYTSMDHIPSRPSVSLGSFSTMSHISEVTSQS